MVLSTGKLAGLFHQKHAATQIPSLQKSSERGVFFYQGSLVRKAKQQGLRGGNKGTIQRGPQQAVGGRTQSFLWEGVEIGEQGTLLSTWFVSGYAVNAYCMLITLSSPRPSEVGLTY